MQLNGNSEAQGTDAYPSGHGDSPFRMLVVWRMSRTRPEDVSNTHRGKPLCRLVLRHSNRWEPVRGLPPLPTLLRDHFNRPQPSRLVSRPPFSLGGPLALALRCKVM